MDRIRGAVVAKYEDNQEVKEESKEGATTITRAAEHLVVNANSRPQEPASLNKTPVSP